MASAYSFLRYFRSQRLFDETEKMNSRWTCIALQVLCLFGGCLGIRSPRDRPNFVVSFVDDLGYGDLGFTGHPTTNTPNLDYYAIKGRRLTTWYSGYPVCSASRTALLTGRQPPRVGMPGVINSLGIEGLPLSEVTVADRLKKEGYKTLILGKWHQGQRAEYLPQARGFDAFYGLPYSVDDGIGYASNCSNENGRVHGVGDILPTERQGNVSKIQLGPEIPLPLVHQLPNEQGYGTILSQPTDLVPLSTNMLTFFKNTTTMWRNQPFFAYVAHPHVHTATSNIEELGPYKQYVGCNFLDATLRGGYGDALAEVDWMFGEMIDHIETLNLENNTLFLFLSDNGPAMRQEEGGGSVGPFSGNFPPYRNVGKGSTWEGGLRMPAFAYWPGQVQSYSKTASVLSTLDILPTLVALASSSKDPSAAKKNDEVVLDGLDFSEVLFSSNPVIEGWRKDKLLPFWNGPDYSKPGTKIYAGRFNQFKIHWVTSQGLIFDGTHNLNYTQVHNPPLVFNVETDPQETYPVNLAKTLMDMIEKQKAALTFQPNAINPAFGMKWALCCDVSTNCTCTKEMPIHKV